MFIYRFEITYATAMIPAVIVAATDEDAFNMVEVELEKYFLMQPEYDEIVLFEKRRLGKGGGYILPAADSAES